MNTNNPLPEYVSRWPLALREAWQDGYAGRAQNKDGRTTLEAYRGAYWDGETRALHECRRGAQSSCADCGWPDATMEYIDPQSPQDRFLLCKLCFDEWVDQP